MRRLRSHRVSGTAAAGGTQTHLDGGLAPAPRPLTGGATHSCRPWAPGTAGGPEVRRSPGLVKATRPADRESFPSASSQDRLHFDFKCFLFDGY